MDVKYWQDINIIHVVTTWCRWGVFVAPSFRLESTDECALFVLSRKV